MFSIALAVGACSTIFCAISAVLWQWLPVPRAHELVAVSYTGPYGQDVRPISYEDYLDYRAQTQALSGLAAYSVVNVAVGSGDRAEYVAGVLASGNLFTVLAAQPVRGRVLTPADDSAPTANAVAVISERIWRSHFNASPDAIGESIRLNGTPFTIVGVVRTDLRTMVGLVVDVWAPLSMQERLDPGENKRADRGVSFLSVIGRLREGRSIEQARTELAAAATRMERAYPSPQRADPRRVRIDPATLLPAGARAGATFVAGFLSLATGVTLALACVNLANLLLARATARRREFGVRLAVGATRARIVLQLLMESVILSLCGGAVGLLLALIATRAIVRMIPQTPTPLAVDLSPDARVLALTLLLSLATGIAFGMSPALRASDLSITDALSDVTAGGGQSRHRRRRRDRLVAVQVALACLLLVVSGLCLRSLQAAEAVESADSAGATFCWDRSIPDYAATPPSAGPRSTVNSCGA